MTVITATKFRDSKDSVLILTNGSAKISYTSINLMAVKPVVEFCVP